MTRVLATLILGAFAVAGLNGCAMTSPLNGSIYTEVTAPVSMGPAATATKTGEAKATSIVGVALGDCSIEQAMKNGGITKVHHVSSKVRNILGVYAEYTTIVHGE